MFGDNAAVRPKEFIAIGARLKFSRHVHTLGFRPNFTDYSGDEQELIAAASKIYYPTAFYADLFNAMGKDTFPSFHTYKFAQNKIKQSAIFNLAGIPHPKTRVFYGPRQRKEILNRFDFPFVVKKPKGSSKGRHVFLISSLEDLESCLEKSGPVYAQSFIPVDRDMRIVVIGKCVALGYWRVAAASDFRTNVSQGGEICFDPLPQEALDLALHTARVCGWDDVGIDIMQDKDRLVVIEANMKYGTQGFKKAGIDYRGFLEKLLLNGRI
ncbi:MAG: ATP-grasp domain-containing protein [Desulfobacteraceae bacterium]|nr:MAG: ATP-grasp domain-containing protein [Desulfobacteraceae bacterium]